MEKKFIKQFGLRKLKPDNRDFKLSAILKLPPLEELPEEFILEPVSVKDQKDTDYCFPAGTMVLTEDFSYKPIEDLGIGDFVMTHSGNIKKITKKYKRLWQGKKTEIKIKGDYRKIIATPNHPFFVVADKRENWRKKKNKIKDFQVETIKAQEIQKGDYLIIPKIKLSKNTGIYSFENDPDFLWVLGLYLAEGSINGDYRVVFSLSFDEINFAKRIKSIMEKYGANVSINQYKERNITIVYLSGESGKWVNIFTELGNEKCYAKKINKRLMFLSPELQMKIIEGFIDGDGYKNSKRVSMICTSYELLNQIRTILFRNNIMSSFQKRKDRENRLQSWCLEFYPDKKRTTFLEDKDNFYVKVFDVKTNQKEYLNSTVYNLEIENDNSYLINGIAVHNCTGMATCGASELQEGVELSPEWSFAASKKISGDPEEFGQDLRTAMKVHIKYGAVEKEEAPYSLEKGDEDSKMRCFNNWPGELCEKAERHKKSSYFKLDGQYCPFDDARAFLWMKKAEKQVPVIGVEWNWPLDMKIMETSLAPGGGHALYVRGFKKIDGKDYLIVQNSYGLEAGDNGKHYFSREIINENVEKYGAFVFIDMPISEAKQKCWTFWQKMVGAIKEYFSICWK